MFESSDSFGIYKLKIGATMGTTATCPSAFPRLVPHANDGTPRMPPRGGRQSCPSLVSSHHLGYLALLPNLCKSIFAHVTQGAGLWAELALNDKALGTFVARHS